MSNEVSSRKGRGLGKKPAMVYISLRVDKEVADYFNSFPSKSKKIREALEQFINQEEEKQNEAK